MPSKPVTTNTPKIYIAPSRLALVEEATAMEGELAQKAGAVGYLARMLVQVTMPHAKQKSNEFTRRNGSFSVTMLASTEYGLPYGTVPRLLLAWLTTEAVRTRESTLVLGSSLSSFLHRLGYTATGGKTGSIGRGSRKSTNGSIIPLLCVMELP